MPRLWGALRPVREVRRRLHTLSEGTASPSKKHRRMKTLYPQQEQHARELYRALLSNRSTLDTSETGTGKTVVAAHIARHWEKRGHHVAVVCPKAVVTSWERELAEHGVSPVFVLNYEKLRNAREGIVRIRRKSKNGRSGKTTKLFQWELPPDTLLVFDEVQWAKAQNSQNAQLLIAAAKQQYPTLSLSATAAEDPTEMRALGYSLGLHELNEKRNNNSYFHWLKRNGCSKDPWNQWRLKKSADLTTLRHEIFQVRKIAHGLKTSDMPGAFKPNTVMVGLGDYKGASKIYDQCGVTKAAVDTLLSNIHQKMEVAPGDDEDPAIVRILRARQYVEALKVPHFVDETNELLRAGKSVIVFLNFRDSINLFRESFPDSGIIIGQQKDRDEHLDAFAEDRTRVIVVSAAAGGTGVSLHDRRGEFPRATLISPTFSVQTYKQVLGRAHRAGMKTPVLQKILIAAGSIEEYVHEKCVEGAQTMKDMLG